LLFAVEVTLLTTLGALRSQAVIGNGFQTGHLVVFFLGAPALANVILLRRSNRIRWYWTVPLCALFAVALVILQYGVSEALYGVE
jgi:hypothetical protein